MSDDSDEGGGGDPSDYFSAFAAIEAEEIEEDDQIDGDDDDDREILEPQSLDEDEDDGGNPAIVYENVGGNEDGDDQHESTIGHEKNEDNYVDEDEYDEDLPSTSYVNLNLNHPSSTSSKKRQRKDDFSNLPSSTTATATDSKKKITVTDILNYACGISTSTTGGGFGDVDNYGDNDEDNLKIIADDTSRKSHGGNRRGAFLKSKDSKSSRFQRLSTMTANGALRIQPPPQLRPILPKVNPSSFLTSIGGGHGSNNFTLRTSNLTRVSILSKRPSTMIDQQMRPVSLLVRKIADGGGSGVSIGGSGAKHQCLLCPAKFATTVGLEHHTKTTHGNDLFVITNAYKPRDDPRKNVDLPPLLPANMYNGGGHSMATFRPQGPMVLSSRGDPIMDACLINGETMDNLATHAIEGNDEEEMDESVVVLDPDVEDIADQPTKTPTKSPAKSQQHQSSMITAEFAHFDLAVDNSRRGEFKRASAQADACHVCRQVKIGQLTEHVSKLHPRWSPCLFSLCTSWFESRADRAYHLRTEHPSVAVKRLPVAALALDEADEAVLEAALRQQRTKRSATTMARSNLEKVGIVRQLSREKSKSSGQSSASTSARGGSRISARKSIVNRSRKEESNDQPIKLDDSSGSSSDSEDNAMEKKRMTRSAARKQLESTLESTIDSIVRDVHEEKKKTTIGAKKSTDEIDDGEEKEDTTNGGIDEEHTIINEVTVRTTNSPRGGKQSGTPTASPKPASPNKTVPPAQPLSGSIASPFKSLDSPRVQSPRKPSILARRSTPMAARKLNLDESTTPAKKDDDREEESMLSAGRSGSPAIMPGISVQEEDDDEEDGDGEEDDGDRSAEIVNPAIAIKIEADSGEEAGGDRMVTKNGNDDEPSENDEKDDEEEESTSSPPKKRSRTNRKRINDEPKSDDSADEDWNAPRNRRRGSRQQQRRGQLQIGHRCDQRQEEKYMTMVPPPPRIDVRQQQRGGGTYAAGLYRRIIPAAIPKILGGGRSRNVGDARLPAAPIPGGGGAGGTVASVLASALQAQSSSSLADIPTLSDYYAADYYPDDLHLVRPLTPPAGSNVAARKSSANTDPMGVYGARQQRRSPPVAEKNKCNSCTLIFPTSFSMTQHVSERHGLTIECRCDRCDNWYRDAGAVAEHIAEAHSWRK